MIEKMNLKDEERYEPFTTRRSILWSQHVDFSRPGSGSVEHESELPVGAQVLGYAFPLATGGFRVEWI